MDTDKSQALKELRERLQMLLAKSICKNVSREEIHNMVDEIYDAYQTEDGWAHV